MAPPDDEGTEVGEGDDGADHSVPAHLLALYEGIEYADAVGDERTDSERYADEDAWAVRYGDEGELSTAQRDDPDPEGS